MKRKILVNGKTSRFCRYLINEMDKKQTIFVNKKQFNILNFNIINKFLIKNKIISKAFSLKMTVQQVKFPDNIE